MGISCRRSLEAHTQVGVFEKSDEHVFVAAFFVCLRI